MKLLAKLKDDARRHEQREEWQLAIDLYLRVLRSAEEGETEFELPLYNRIGDLYVRLGRPADAVGYYEQAADRYADAGLFNNAIALCNKALRYLPDRLELFRKLGRFSASQGFLTDARQWFLEYAQRMFARGELDDAFGALEDFADITEDADVRADFARQLVAHDRSESALQEFRRAYSAHLRAGHTEAAERVREEARALLPDAADVAIGVDLSDHADDAVRDETLPGYGEPLAATAAFDDDEPLASEQREPHELADAESDAYAKEQLAGYEATAAADSDEVAEQPSRLEGLESTTVETGDVDHVEEIEGFDTGRAEEEPITLPLLDDDGADAEDEELPVADPDAGADEDRTPLPLLDAPVADERHSADDLYGVATVDYSAPPPPEEPLPPFEPEPHVDQVEQPDEPLPDLPALPEPHSDASAPPAGDPWADAAATAGSTNADDYVDLFAFINPDEDRVIATRFFVEEKQPTGDEDRDFAEMLAEFKAKVAAHVGEHDSGSHYDLGLAFKEMGLIDEAIGEFQVALRAGANRLKVFEELGQCFILKRQPTIAVKILARALQIEHEDELEMIGVYYHLGRAYEELGQIGEARDAYERVLGLDIGFKDVMDRVSRL